MATIDHIILKVNDLDKSVDFYSGIMGFSNQGTDGPFVVIRVSDDFQIQLAAWGTPGFEHYAFAVSRGDFDQIFERVKAAEIDFADVLAKKNATVSLRQIIRELEAAQAPVWSPIILNGSGFGLWANHSLVMASYISRANAALIDLRELLAQG